MTAGRFHRLTVEDSGIVIGERIEAARSFGARLRGLMFRKSLAEGEGLLLLEVRSIHMGFMRFPIDAIFLDADWTVTSVASDLAPWFQTARCGRARHVLELPAGSAARLGIGPGARLAIEAGSA